LSQSQTGASVHYVSARAVPGDQRTRWVVWASDTAPTGPGWRALTRSWFECRVDPATITHEVAPGDETTLPFVALRLTATPASMAFTGHQPEDFLHFMIDPKTAEKLAEAMLAGVREIRRRQN
jgi:hypothetical protein